MKICACHFSTYFVGELLHLSIIEIHYVPARAVTSGGRFATRVNGNAWWKPRAKRSSDHGNSITACFLKGKQPKKAKDLPASIWLRSSLELKVGRRTPAENFKPRFSYRYPRATSSIPPDPAVVWLTATALGCRCQHHRGITRLLLRGSLSQVRNFSSAVCSHLTTSPAISACAYSIGIGISTPPRPPQHTNRTCTLSSPMYIRSNYPSRPTWASTTLSAGPRGCPGYVLPYPWMSCTRDLAQLR